MVRPLRILLASLALWPAASLAQSADAPDGEIAMPEAVWAGEVFDLAVTWRLDWDAFQNFDGELEWDQDVLVVEPWRAPEITRPAPDAEPLATVRRAARAMAPVAGQASLPPARQGAVVQTGSVAADFGTRAVTGPVTLETSPAPLEVRPLPPAPDDFLGAVGDFELVSTVEPEAPRAGEPLRWTLTLQGTGNWPNLDGLPARSRPASVSIAADRAQSETGATVFDRALSETVFLVPETEGELRLAPVSFEVFDPEAGAYRRLTTQEIVLQVSPAAPGAQLPPAPVATGPVAEADEPQADDALPPPLEGSARALAPMPDRLWRAGLILPVLVVALSWVGLAALRAWLADPYRRARAGQRRLARDIARIENAADDPARRAPMRAWQRDAALRWTLPGAAPDPRALPGADWRALWAQADAFLYGPPRPLPPDWPGRARAALAAAGAPAKFEPPTILRRRHFQPWAAAALLAIALLIPPQQGQAQAPNAPEHDDHHAELHAGETDPAPEAIPAAADPLDWKARYGRARDYAEREAWPQAAAEAGAAWVQNPASEHARRIWMRASSMAGFPAAQSGGLVRPVGLGGALAALLSPALWRIVAIALASLAAAGAILALAAGGFGRRRASLAGAGVLAVSLCLMAAPLFALSAYGAAASPAAVLVWRGGPLRDLPVEAPRAEGDLMVSTGALGAADGAYLDWRRVRFPDGSRGWVRGDTLVWIWGEPAGRD